MFHMEALKYLFEAFPSCDFPVNLPVFVNFLDFRSSFPPSSQMDSTVLCVLCEPHCSGVGPVWFLVFGLCFILPG